MQPSESPSLSPAGRLDFAILAQRLRGSEGACLCADARRRLESWDYSEAHRQWAQILRFASRRASVATQLSIPTGA